MNYIRVNKESTFEEKVSSLFMLNSKLSEHKVSIYLIDTTNQYIGIDHQEIRAIGDSIALTINSAPPIPQVPEPIEYFDNTEHNIIPKVFIVFDIESIGQVIFRIKTIAMQGDQLGISLYRHDYEIIEIPVVEVIDRKSCATHLKMVATTLGYAGLRDFINDMQDRKIIRSIEYDYKPKLARKITLDYKKFTAIYKYKNPAALKKYFDENNFWYTIQDKDIVIGK